MSSFYKVRGNPPMLDLINHILISYTLPGLVLCFGLCFFFIIAPDRGGLMGYRMARRMMGCAYLFYFAALLVQSFVRTMPSSTLLHSMIVIVIGLLQAFLFTFALTTLIDVKFFTWRRFVREFLLVLLPILVCFLLFSAYFPHAEWVGFLLLTLFYLVKMTYYVLHFRRRYHDYEQRMDNYFSDDERKRLKWVNRSFYTALSIGILALLYGLFPSMLTSLLFALAVIIYYTIFGIRFLNYAFTFQQIEAAMVDEHEDASSETGNTAAVATTGVAANRQLLERLNTLMMTQRLYTHPDLTIEDVAVQAGESHRTISAAINACKDTNFKGWVNAYRVEEAERLIRDGFLTNHTIDALAVKVGFANRITLHRVFKKLTGKAPTDF
ncbi:MAG: helix-turn-helix domain-containing protein [Bacteroidaceae bacterium]|nr:helix-turn-helix domain-containing protein [Bacteroidaceae bacterium]